MVVGRFHPIDRGSISFEDRFERAREPNPRGFDTRRTSTWVDETLPVTTHDTARWKKARPSEDDSK